MLIIAGKSCFGLRNYFLPCISCGRQIYSESKSWPEKYKKKTRLDIERYWGKKLSERWKQAKKSQNKTSAKPKFYCLSMFPYPSGKLHMGHVRVYTISDAMAHYHRMNGKEVIHPIGWDAFGLPAENAAITRGLDPSEWTEQNIAAMKKQLIDLDIFFDWEKEISTCQPEYYKWTQYLFVKLFKAGLAYRAEAAVNWDPVDKTVLANEQVDEEGRSWRSGAVVEKRFLEQWFLKITKYSESLLETLPELEEEFGIKAMQRHWIGDINGTLCKFNLKLDGHALGVKLPVYCTHPERIDQASHVNVQTPYLDQLADLLRQSAEANVNEMAIDILKVESGQHITGLTAENPFTHHDLKLIISDHHSEEHPMASALLGVPAVNEVDMDIAKRLECPLSTDKETMTKNEALNKTKTLDCGEGFLQSSGLSDWLISRQRRWGTPIPIVFCPQHGAVAVPEEELPVVMPPYREPLDQWKKTTCPKCGVEATRETDTMDTFVDSSWYFFRYTDPHNATEPFSKELGNKLMPVDLYIGGKEHAILHLYYARFFSHFCADLGLIDYREPFKKLLAQGLIRGKTYRLKSTGKYLSPDEVVEKDGKHYERSSDEEVEASFEKMSKSKMNGVDPGEFVSEWGITITRLFVLYAAAPFESIDWDVKTDVIPGMMRWQMRLWRCVTALIKSRKEESAKREAPLDDEYREWRLVQLTNETITQVTELYEKSCTLSAAITLLMTLAKETSNCPQSIVDRSPHYERAVCVLIIMSAPLIPHYSSELWEGLRSMTSKKTDFNWDGHVLDQQWPKPVPTPEAKWKKLFVRVDRKHCTVIHHLSDMEGDVALQTLALNHDSVLRRIAGSEVDEVTLNGNRIDVTTRSQNAVEDATH